MSSNLNAAQSQYFRLIFYFVFSWNLFPIKSLQCEFHTDRRHGNRRIDPYPAKDFEIYMLNILSRFSAILCKWNVIIHTSKIGREKKRRISINSLFMAHKLTNHIFFGYYTCTTCSSRTTKKQTSNIYSTVNKSILSPLYVLRVIYSTVKMKKGEKEKMFRITKIALAPRPLQRDNIK